MFARINGFLSIRRNIDEASPATPSVFGVRDEIALLVLPFIMAVAAFFAYANGFDGRNNAIILISNVFLLNLAHTIFTPTTMLCLPEVRKWVQDYNQTHRFGFWTTCFGLFFAAYIIQTLLGQARHIYFLIPAYAYGRFHFLAQHRGISFCYNEKFRRENTHLTGVRDLFWFSERLERNGTYILTVFHGAILAFGLLRVHNLWYVGSAVFGSCIGLAMIFVSCYVLPRAVRSKKWIFSARYYFYLAEVRAPVVVRFLDGTHGIEYFLVNYRLMVKNSSVRKTAYFVLLLGLVIGGTYACLGSLPKSLLQETLGRENGSAVAWVVMRALSSYAFVHYLLDARLFKMRDPQTRALMSPLLFGDKPSVLTAELDTRQSA